MGNFLDLFQTDQVFLDDAALALALPAFPMSAIGLEKWFGKSAKAEQWLKVGSGGLRIDLVKRERMQAVVVVTGTPTVTLQATTNAGAVACLMRDTTFVNGMAGATIISAVKIG